MKLLCLFLGHDWGPQTPWSTYTIEVPWEGDFMVQDCRRKGCKAHRKVPGSETGPGKRYVLNKNYKGDNAY